MTTITVDTTVALNSALKAAKAGDTIQLASGNYGDVAIRDLSFATDVTIVSQDALNPAVVGSLNVKDVTGLTFRDVEFAVRGATKATQVNVTESQDIHFEGIYLHGSLDGVPGNDPAGMLIRESSNVTVTDSEFAELYWGVAHLNTTNLSITGSDFHDLRVDGVRGGGSSYVNVSNNHFSDFGIDVGDHPDAIQFWTTNTTASAHHFVIENNVFQRGDGSHAQGVFFRDQVGDLPFEGIVIRGNLIVGGMYNGIYVTGGRDVVIEDNIVQGLSDMKSWIRLDDVQGGVVKDNMANLFLFGRDVVNVSQANNDLVGLASDAGAAMTELWEGVQGLLDPAPSETGAETGTETGAETGTETGAETGTETGTGIETGTGGGSGGAEQPSGGLLLIGGAGADTLRGGDLADTISGGAGLDILAGGKGDDIYVGYGDALVVEAVGGGVDTVRASQTSFTLQANVENLELTGTRGTWGGGNALDNVITGNAGGNHLYGRAGSDTVSGGAGDDLINGGAGADGLTGGAGVDRFVFTRGDGSDVVRDFGLGGEHDVLDLSGFYARELMPTLVESAAGVTVSFTSGDQILLATVKLSNLHATLDGYVF